MTAVKINLAAVKLVLSVIITRGPVGRFEYFFQFYDQNVVNILNTKHFLFFISGTHIFLIFFYSGNKIIKDDFKEQNNWKISRCKKIICKKVSSRAHVAHESIQSGPPQKLEHF